MTEKILELKLCPNCGSTEYMENYPTPGTSICDDCGHEITSIVLKELKRTLSKYFFARRKCSSCGLQDPAEESLLDDFSFFRVVVYKCKRCGKLDGYRIVPKPGAYNEEQMMEILAGKQLYLRRLKDTFFTLLQPLRKLPKLETERKRSHGTMREDV